MSGAIFDYWQAIVGLFAIIGVYFAYRQWKADTPKTTNTIRQGNRNQQEGGKGQTENRIDHGDDNAQKG
jgi:hypothetical protein